MEWCLIKQWIRLYGAMRSEEQGELSLLTYSMVQDII
jgi:hypothetical protein